MNNKRFVIWFSIAGAIGVLFGIFYAFFGLSGFPAYHELIPSETMVPWSNGLYGSTFIGFSVLLFFIGRYAFIKSNTELMKALLYGILAWLIIEAAFSLFYGVYFNIGVDLLLTVFLGYPLMKGIRQNNKQLS